MALIVVAKFGMSSGDQKIDAWRWYYTHEPRFHILRPHPHNTDLFLCAHRSEDAIMAAHISETHKECPPSDEGGFRLSRPVSIT